MPLTICSATLDLSAGLHTTGADGVSTGSRLLSFPETDPESGAEPAPSNAAKAASTSPSQAPDPMSRAGAAAPPLKH